ncbi:type VI secretion protein [Sorangium cellulosum]|uniref:Type VI secretion protein n=1 Tax=Sorangium cellulosum TaxID=56 RepID=A0A150RAC7_SORCE|nr:type VI secretion protein [Sorangium cellulosum]
MFVNTQMGGVNTGFPDVCLTPAPPAPAPVPVPYPNIATGVMGTPAVYNVLTSCAPTHNLGTVIPLSNGDNAGVATGVASGTVMGPCRHVTGSFTVLVGGMPLTKLTSMSIQNSTNCPGMRVAPSQVTVLSLGP